VRDLARALGWRWVPVPRAAVSLGAAAGGLPLMPTRAQWLNALSVPVLMDSGRARRELRWRPKHDALSTLEATVAGGRERGVV